jgi:hypothetical protein
VLPAGGTADNSGSVNESPTSYLRSSSTAMSRPYA